MKILLYSHYKLEEKASQHLRLWKVWHTILYIVAAVFGILNFVFLQSCTSLIDNHCLLFPNQLEFHWTLLPANVKPMYTTTERISIEKTSTVASVDGNERITETAPTNFNTSEESASEEIKIRKRRDVEEYEFVTKVNETEIEDSNATIITGNKTHRLTLDTSRSLFAKDNDCDYQHFMPILSTVFAVAWLTLFIMCPGGGRSRMSDLQQPWRILTPALFFALVMVGLTGHSFTTTNGGLHAFCAAFHNYTDTDACSAVDPFLELSWNTSWSFGGRVAATRATSAGVWVSWACAATLLLARCLTAQDFELRRTGVYLIKDPKQRIVPHLQRQKSPRRSNRLPTSLRKDTASINSEPTVTTELVTASLEHAANSASTSVSSATPAIPSEEGIEMTYNPSTVMGRRDV